MYNYRYEFQRQNAKPVLIDMVVEDGLLSFEDQAKELPEWTLLEHSKCASCPLVSERRCPAAVALHNVIRHFASNDSFDMVDLTVDTPERRYTFLCTLQSALGSLIGLVLPLSGCPHTTYFKPMARMHLPLSSEEETMFRVCANFYLRHYFQGDTQTATLDDLNEVYARMHEVNQGLAGRIQNAAEGDSATNAIVLLDCLTHSVPHFVDRSLKNLAPWFDVEP